MDTGRGKKKNEQPSLIDETEDSINSSVGGDKFNDMDFHIPLSSHTSNQASSWLYFSPLISISANDLSHQPVESVPRWYFNSTSLVKEGPVSAEEMDAINY